MLDSFITKPRGGVRAWNLPADSGIFGAGRAGIRQGGAKLGPKPMAEFGVGSEPIAAGPGVVRQPSKPHQRLCAGNVTSVMTPFKLRHGSDPRTRAGSCRHIEAGISVSGEAGAHARSSRKRAEAAQGSRSLRAGAGSAYAQGLAVEQFGDMGWPMPSDWPSSIQRS